MLERYLLALGDHEVTWIGFAFSGWCEKVWGELELMNADGPGGDDFTHVVAMQVAFEGFVATRAPGHGDVPRLWLLEGHESDRIAEAPR